MKTPICDFINEYVENDKLRLHMPGHKGKKQLGFEKYDITEIVGADSLYHADGIIKQSEENATSLFETQRTLYSTEGSSHIIRAMLYLAKLYSGESNGYVLAGRNAHSSFISACVLNDIDIEWLYPKETENYLSCAITADILENVLRRVDKKPICVYITSPDYLGNMCDIASLSEVCKHYGTLLIVDNAHGAYLKFLKEDLHPISLGATMCCDSAHKTLPVLTGGAYLHISKESPAFFSENAKSALSLFGSTSPSYLTLASLDNANKYISRGFGKELDTFIEEIGKCLSNFQSYDSIRSILAPTVMRCTSSRPAVGMREPLKLVLETKKIGYRGGDFAKILEEKGVVCEFFDDDFLVLMPSLENGIEQIKELFEILSSIEVKASIESQPPSLIPPQKKMTVREASFAQKELIPIEKAIGRVLASTTVSCPPAVSVIVCGEEFNQSAIEMCKYYGIHSCYVIK